MGVQGFPTLKIVKPSKKPGKPIVEDYQGGRTAKDIVDAVKQAIPNNVKRISDKGLNAWLDANNDTAKAILFSDKGTTGALIKVVATDYLGRINFAQVRNKETAAVEMFGIATYPSLVVLPGGTEPPVLFGGSFSKASMKEFLDQYASSTKSASAQKPKKEQKPLVAEDEPSAQAPAEAEETAASASASSAFSFASSSHASEEGSATPSGATTETLDDNSQPTESPDPNIVPEDTPKPAAMPDLAPPIPALIERVFLEQRCLSPKTTTCILALLPQAVDDEQASLAADASTALASLAEIAEKHSQRGGKPFIFSVPARNAGQGALREALQLSNGIELVVVNAKRGWYRRYEGADGFGKNALENWIDAIRLGEGAKASLPDGLVMDEKESAKESKMEEHGEL
ncbi:MAG: hypothetical protein Q9207_000261 [Kuettlingeria erythrocarpa]